MNRNFLIAIVLFLFAPNCFGAIDDNIDYNFMNNAFSNPNPTTNRDFEKVMEQYKNPKEGLFTKIYKFFDKDKAKYDKNLKTKYENPNKQPKRLKDTPEELPTIMISAISEDSTGNIVKVGYYQVEHKKKEDGKYELNLMQGSNNKIATLVARPIEEDEKATEIMYARSEALNNGFIKVYYGNLDVTLVGYLKIKEDEKEERFEPVF